jgi:hypothetical protein
MMDDPLFDDAELIEVETVLSSDTLDIRRGASTPETRARYAVIKSKWHDLAGGPVALPHEADRVPVLSDGSIQAGTNTELFPKENEKWPYMNIRGGG